MRGLTLIELIVVVFILTIILLATFAVLTRGRHSWQIGTKQAEVQQEARRAMDAMLKELRAASSIDPSTFTSGVSNDFIRFTKETETIEFAVIATALQRSAAGSTTIMARDIAAIQFNLSGGNVIYITLTTQKQTPFGHLVKLSLNSQVVLRN